MPDETPHETRADRFADGGIDRRTFLGLSAATGAALALPGNAAASVSDEVFSAEYQYVQNHTPEGHAVPTLVRFREGADPTALESFDGDAISVTDPEPAAYGRLTAAEASAAADLPTASEFQFAPGSNPFWRIGYYPFGVFPEPTRSVDYIGFEQLKDGLGEIESRHPERVRIRNVGRSPGHLNDATDRPDPKGLYVAEVTNFDSEASFEEKEKVFFSCSLHGPERAGAEAGARVIENVARGSEPDITGSDAKVEPLLDDMVIIFGFVNPDGWVARNPQYESSWQFDIPGVKGLTLYERGNAGIYDTNRQYPSLGYIIPPPGHYPAEPSAGTDAPDYMQELVPDAADLIEHFRDYRNLNYGADLHGGPIFNEFVLGLISQDQFNSRDLHELYEMCLNIDDTLEEALEIWTTAGDVKTSLLGDTRTGLLFGVLPEQAFDYGTIYDTIDYTVSGAFLDWMAHPEITDDEGNVVGGGLGMTTLDFEMSFSWAVNGNLYNPELVRQEVIGYRTAIRVISEFGFRNTDTPSDGSVDEFDVTTGTDGEDVAFVTTGEVGGEADALRRTDEDLVFTRFEEVEQLNYSGVIAPGAAGSTTAEHTFTMPDGADRVEATCSWVTNVQDLDFFLEDGSGDRIAGSTNFGGPERITTSDPEPGRTYTFVVETFASGPTRYEIDGSARQSTTAGESEGDSEFAFGSTTDATTVENRVAGGSTTAVQYDVDRDLHSLTIHPHAPDVVFDLELVGPDGATVQSFDGVTEKRVGGKCCGLPEWVVESPDQGTYTLEVSNLEPDPKPFEIQFGTLQSTGTATPDPKVAVGYEQRPYDVTPFSFFQDYAEFIDSGSMDPVTVDEVANGALSEYDHAVVIHDYLNEDMERARKSGAADSGYTGALDTFVDDGGNLVLTDTGNYLLPLLDNDLVDGSRFGQDAITRTFDDVAQFTSKSLNHPLFGTDGDVRPIQDQLWKVAPLGYGVSGEARMDVIREEAFAAAATSAEGVPSVAGRVDGAVGAGSITASEDEGTGIHTICSLLPPAKQTNLHPFGMLNYTATFLGYVMFTSALGFEQIRDVGTEVRRYGRGDEWDLSGVDPVEPPAPEFSASGSRSDDGDVFTGGQTDRVRVTVESIDGEVDGNQQVELTDGLPDDWSVIRDGDGEPFGDAVGTDDGTVVLGSLTEADVSAGSVSRTYYAEAPEGAGATGEYTFGPAEVTATIDGATVTAEVAGTETAYVVGPSTNVL